MARERYAKGGKTAREKARLHMARWRAKPESRERLRELNAEKRTEWAGWKFDRPITRNGAGNRVVREEAIEAYGGRCECCGIRTREFLTIDHVNGGGGPHRRATKTTYFYRWLKQRGFPQKGYRLLCYNCNSALGHRGYCPHQKKKGTYRWAIRMG